VTPPRPGIRVSEADRELAAARLYQALAEGRITLSELEERIAVVYAARYEADLRPPLADLPGHDDVLAPVPATPPHLPREVLRAGLTGLRRRGSWSVPSRLRLETRLGSIVLDFCETPLPPVVDIEVAAGPASVRLLVPDTATADVAEHVEFLGPLVLGVPVHPRVGATHFVLRGSVGGSGSVVVRRRRRFLGRHF
jgi:hypothetical protein